MLHLRPVVRPKADPSVHAQLIVPRLSALTAYVRVHTEEDHKSPAIDNTSVPVSSDHNTTRSMSSWWLAQVTSKHLVSDSGRVSVRLVFFACQAKPSELCLHTSQSEVSVT